MFVDVCFPERCIKYNILFTKKAPGYEAVFEPVKRTKKVKVCFARLYSSTRSIYRSVVKAQFKFLI